MTESVQLPPPSPPPAKKYTLVDYLFQFITITAGVLIALLINGLVEWNDNRELVQQARATIALELTANKKDLDETLVGMAEDVRRFDAALRFANDILSRKKVATTELKLNLNLADLSSTGWRTAERTGALSHMPYDEVQKYSKLYDLQDLFVEQQRATFSEFATAMATLTADFNPDSADLREVETFRERILVVRSAWTLQEQVGGVLAQTYAEALQK